MPFKFEKLHVWHRSIKLAEELLTFSGAIPKMYQFSLGDQLRRASLSVPTNIAEGTGRGLRKDQANFYRIAKGSVHEVASLLVILFRLKIISEEVFTAHYEECCQIAAMLGALMKPRNIN